MKKSLLTLLLLLSWLGLTAPAEAKLKVVTTYPYIAELVRQIAGSHVDIQSLAPGNWDPHVIVPRPSLLIHLRQGNLLIINGAQLELGWLPPLLRQANNNQIMPGNPGFLELSGLVTLSQKPTHISRAMGDVHPQGNPHFYLDPYLIPQLATGITNKLCQVDAGNCVAFKRGQKQFAQHWQASLLKWSKKMQPLQGRKVMEYHRLFDYFLQRYRLVMVQTIEPLPGIPPSPAGLNALVKQAKQQKITYNIRGIYNPPDPSQFVSQQSHIPLLTLPHDVGAVAEATDLFRLFDTLVAKFQ